MYFFMINNVKMDEEFVGINMLLNHPQSNRKVNNILKNCTKES